MSRSSRLYRISWINLSGHSERTFESDDHDAIDVARTNDGIITYQGEDYIPDELETRLNSPDYDKELKMEFPMGGSSMRTGADSLDERQALIARAEGRTPVLRSCWECNGAHKHLKEKNNTLFLCIGCNRYFMDGVFLTEAGDKNANDWDEESFGE